MPKVLINKQKAEESYGKCYVLLTVHLGIILFNDQRDAQFLLYKFGIFCICILCNYFIYVCIGLDGTVQTCIPDGHLHTVTYNQISY